MNNMQWECIVTVSLWLPDTDSCESPKILAGVSYCMSLSGETPFKNVSRCDDMQPTLQQNKILSLDSNPLNLLPWQQRWSLSCIKAEASDTCSAKAKYKHTLTGGSRTAMRGRWGQQLLGYLCCKVLSSERKTWEHFPGFTWCPWARLLRQGLSPEWVWLDFGAGRLCKKQFRLCFSKSTDTCAPFLIQSLWVQWALTRPAYQSQSVLPSFPTPTFLTKISDSLLNCASIISDW